MQFPGQFETILYDFKLHRFVPSPKQIIIFHTGQ